MDLDYLCNDIIEVRAFNVNSNAEYTQSKHGVIIPTFSFIVKFKSSIIRDHVLKIKRKIGAIKCYDIYTSGETLSSNETIALYEMLPEALHNLRLLTKEKAKQCNFKYVWAREGKIYVQRNDQSERIVISSKADLSKIK